MNKEDIIKQLESLQESQRNFVPNDDTGVFERDCLALELAIRIIKGIEESDLNSIEDIRICSDCGKMFYQGFVIDGGLEYYCSEDCLHKHYSDEEYNEMYDDGNGDSYYTEW